MAMLEKSDVRRHLFSMFLDQLKEDDQLIAQYGKNFDEACRSLNYATAVRYEMLNEEESERFKQQVPSAHTLLRWLQRGDFSAQVQSRSLLAVARYLGFEHFDDYQKSIAADTLSTPVDEDLATITDSNPVAVPTQKSRSINKRGIFWGIAGAVLGILLTYVFVVAVTESKRQTPLPTELHIKSLIERTNAFEYNLYAQVGRQGLDTSGHHLFFTSSSPAWKTIERVLLRSQDSNFVLNLDRSRRALVAVAIEDATDSTIIVKSQEAWNIVWESETANNKQYDTVNEQFYTLKKEDDRWKVFSNAYSGKSVPVEE